ncbi:uncharacterized protein PHALS_02982 [Plasmopara halstedii]|uniref:Uncharacterized protein n=1 Tax=Plasmopara halstedii TaxID=4781 RepID=A0A0N7L3P3_PLAHL|nr:uncharacterized protein PHALS_02982 [Plasmopara halstedii]CEG36435.1 hypothetical protein PHALS_02982 [Plasmopara halstedii]|eukprot:XP_024572804.1 hypothetical protein PHALS_02982 [Plasmopara halstedii]
MPINEVPPGIDVVIKCLGRLDFPVPRHMVNSTNALKPIFRVDQSNTRMLSVDLVIAHLVQHIQNHKVTKILREVAAHQAHPGSNSRSKMPSTPSHRLIDKFCFRAK